MYSIQTTAVFDAWFDGLRDRHAKARIQVRIDRFLLAGGDKSTQASDIKSALKLAPHLEA